MDIIQDIASTVLAQMQKPTLAFLIGGMMIAALGSKLEVPSQVYKFVVMVLLLKVGMGAGISVREAEFTELLVPAIAAAALGVGIVLLGAVTLARRPGIAKMDAMATVGLFGAVSASSLAAGMAMLDDQGIAYEGFIGALYPFMDIAALLTAIVLARLSAQPQTAATLQGGGTATMGGGTGGGFDLKGSMQGVNVREILVETARSPAISALLLGLAIGTLSKPGSVYESFYQQVFHGLLSILMLCMGMEAWSRLSEMRKVAHTYVIYGITAPLVHGLLGIGAGYIVHQITGFSEGGIVLLAVLAASSSDISGPPTLRGALPEANPSAYIGTSTGVGTPVAILAIPLWIALAEVVVNL